MGQPISGPLLSVGDPLPVCADAVPQGDDGSILPKAFDPIRR
jgi:hypothetical protein